MRAYVDPQMARILADIAAAPAIDFKAMPIAEARALSDAGTIPWSFGAPAIPAWEVEVPGAAGPMRGRLYHPNSDSVLPLIVFVHGGGWTFGSIDTHDGTMRNLAVASGYAVFGFDYRLAPEHPFPAPLDDALAALAFIEREGLGAQVDRTRWALSGDSAGATLALSAMIRRREAGRSLRWQPCSTAVTRRTSGPRATRNLAKAIF